MTWKTFLKENLVGILWGAVSYSYAYYKFYCFFFNCRIETPIDSIILFPSKILFWLQDNNLFVYRFIENPQDESIMLLDFVLSGLIPTIVISIILVDTIKFVFKKLK